MNRRSASFLVIITGGLFLAISVIYGLNYFSNKDKAKLEIISVPGDAKIEIIGESKTLTTRSGDKYLEPGKYKVRGSKDGFGAFETDIEVDDSKKTLVVLLDPESDGAKKWAEKNSKKYQQAESIAGRLSQEAGEKFRANNPIIEKLPLNEGYYRIDYGEDENNNLVLYITADRPVGRQVGIEKIRFWGYEPSDFRIKFNNLKNPFEKGEINE